MEATYSVNVLQNFIDKLPSTKRAFEVGGGIGRITKACLGKIFEECDILD